MLQTTHDREKAKQIKKLPGQSVLGEDNCPTTSSKVPAHASLLVKKSALRLNNFFMVAGIDECSNSEVKLGPFGLPTTAQFKLDKLLLVFIKIISSTISRREHQEVDLFPC